MRGFLYALLLAGCVPVADPLPVAEPLPVGGHGAPQASCGAEGLQDLVGQSADRLKVMRFAGPMRVILPGQMVTMDYQGDRITITVDAKGKISNLTCG